MAPIHFAHWLRNGSGHTLRVVDAICGTALYARYDRARIRAVMVGDQGLGFRNIWRNFRETSKTQAAS